MQDPDDRYVRTAVFVMLSLAAVAGASATAIHWLAPVHRLMDLIIPPLGTVIFAGLIVALIRRPDAVLGIMRAGLAVGAVALAAPSWLYSLEAATTPGVRLIEILPPVSALFVVYLALLMIFIPGRRAYWATGVAWCVIALPVLAYLLDHPAELWTARGSDLLMAYGPVSVLIVVLLPIQRGLNSTIRRLALERNRMESMLHRDPLTGVQSRLLGERLLRDVLRAGTPAGVVMFDLDRFKAINDTHGHPVGDRVLQTVARGCSGLLREDECISRWGGEEFLVIVPHVDGEGLLRVAERLQHAVASLAMAPVEQVTASFGATMVRPGDALDSVLQRADLAMYRAKELGGNRVVPA
ncbi:MAG: GGDEF domain-containing protein [Xanthomonadaceae bacterium]|nr:GGDEF domain-containing protein [Xanthomonadaceae bacterium]MDE1965305.1 GGDEF domain-containing protein [Xanthomonadaceae bacterium]